MTWPWPSRRTFLAFDFITVLPKLTWPSPPITTAPFLRAGGSVGRCRSVEGEAVGEELMGFSGDMALKWGVGPGLASASGRLCASGPRLDRAFAPAGRWKECGQSAPGPPRG